MRHKLRALRDKKINTDSAGTSAYHIGEAPDSRTCSNAKKHGVDISDLRARQFVPSDFDKFDLIYVMDQSNYENVVAQARNEHDKAKVKLILDELYPGQNREVPDPYFGGEEGFQHVYDLLDKATDKIITKYFG